MAPSIVAQPVTASAATLIGEEDPVFAGGSYVIVQKTALRPFVTLDESGVGFDSPAVLATATRSAR
jgi:hypothetical protein